MLRYLKSWIDQLRWQRLKPMEKLARMLLDHPEGIFRSQSIACWRVRQGCLPGGPPRDNPAGNLMRENPSKRTLRWSYAGINSCPPMNAVGTVSESS